MHSLLRPSSETLVKTFERAEVRAINFVPNDGKISKSIENFSNESIWKATVFSLSETGNKMFLGTTSLILELMTTRPGKEEMTSSWFNKIESRPRAK
ncbi:hypothetical protein WICPIJ_008671 [Wickerhamomyces pijperi]|uniref:Uncharacterized protein n=1 Tax=Wickerhamomyces pijperi TaxID=599730 RepID=A0A9P8PW41_WICPI|nr:hypothetical protein WICPIJ_008671 [Wickerhamomyces pijperi]